MVDFARQIATEQVPNFTARSQGYSTAAIGDLFKNIGYSAQEAGQAIGEQAKSQAISDIQSTIERVDVDFGFVPSGEEPDAPAAFNSQLERMRRMGVAAQKSGGTLQQLYYSRLNAATRDLRAKYPGLAEKIDAEVAQIIGVNPREAARQEAIRAEGAAQRAFEANQSAKTKFYTEDGVALFAGIDPNTVDEATFNQHQIAMARWNQRGLMLKRAKEEGEWNIYSVEEAGNQIYSALMTNVESKVQPVLKKALSGVTLGAEEKQQLLSGIATARSQLTNALDRELYGWVSAENGIRTSDVNKVKQDILNRLSGVETLISKDQLNAANYFATLNSMTKDEDLNTVIQSNPAIRDYNALRNSGMTDETISRILNKKYDEEGGDDWTSAVTLGFASNTGGDFASVAAQLDSPTYGSTKRRNNNFRNTVKKSMDVLTESSNSTEVSNTVKNIYSGDTLSRALEFVDDGDLSLLVSLSNPRITKNIQKVNPEALNEYTNGLTQALFSSKSFRERLNTLRSVAPNNQFMLDPNGRIIYSNPEEQSRGFRQGTTLPSQVTMGTLQDINPVFDNIKKAVEASGSDWEGYITEFMQGRGIPLNKTEEVSQQTESQSSSLEGVQITPTSGTTTMAEFMGTDDRVASLYSDPVNLDIAAKTLVGEARGESSEGRQAIAEVLRNRSLASGRSIAEEAQLRKGKSKFGQFSTWNEGDPNLKLIEDLDETSPLYETAAQDFLTSANSDITKGATHYYNPDIADPAWAKDGNFVETTRIGKHVFGYLKKGDPYLKGLTKYRNRSEFD